MKISTRLIGCALLLTLGIATNAHSWPAAALESRDENCLGCHEQGDNWTDTTQIIIDIIDPETGESFRGPDGSFTIAIKRGTERRVKSVFGVAPEVKFPPDIVGWLYVSPDALESAHESDLKFAPGWSVNRPFCGKRLREVVKGYPGHALAAITMTLRPGETAQDAAITLQVLLKSMARGMTGDYFERIVHLNVTD
jgi:hypothetical protein